MTIKKIYIDCMTPEEIKKYNEQSKREFEKSSVFDVFKYNEPLPGVVKWGLFFPLFLFIAGISVPFLRMNFMQCGSPWFLFMRIVILQFVLTMKKLEKRLWKRWRLFVGLR